MSSVESYLEHADLPYGVADIFLYLRNNKPKDFNHGKIFLVFLRQILHELEFQQFANRLLNLGVAIKIADMEESDPGYEFIYPLYVIIDKEDFNLVQISNDMGLLNPIIVDYDKIMQDLKDKSLII